jgi:gas vesicle protein
VRDRAAAPPEEDSTDQPEPVLAVDLEWQNRVVSAEKRAEALLADVRAGLAPHLAKELMNELVRKLVADREGLMQANHIAASEVARLERRFSRLHADLQQQLKDYQLRTVELQKQLQARTEQNRELLRSQIEALQKKVP